MRSAGTAVHPFRWSGTPFAGLIWAVTREVTDVPKPDVEFVMNCFERNIEAVTTPGFLSFVTEQHKHPFALRTLLINNVADRQTAEGLAQACVDRGEVDRFMFVADHLPRALQATGLRVGDFGSYLHWSDCCLVALNAPGPDLLCYVDIDLRLSRQHDWVQEAITIMAREPAVAVANPNWVHADGSTSVTREADRAGDGYFVGYGFSDQVFLLRRSRFSGKLRRRWVPMRLDSPASARWEVAAEGHFFEEFMDAYMRRRRLLRLTLLSTSFEPVPMSEYAVVSLRGRIRRRRDATVIKALTAAQRWAPCLVRDPRLRTVGLLSGTADRSRPTGQFRPGATTGDRASD